MSDLFTNSEIKELEQAALKDLYKYLPDTGEFYHAKKRRGVSNLDSPIGTVDNGYSRIRVNNKLQRAHRLAWVYENGDIPEGMIIDHIDHNKLNNAIKNLRLATLEENSHNLSMPRNNTSGISGVYEDRGKWRAKIKTDYLGTYKTKEDAVNARMSALKDMGFHDNHGIRKVAMKMVKGIKPIKPIKKFDPTKPAKPIDPIEPIKLEPLNKLAAAIPKKESVKLIKNMTPEQLKAMANKFKSSFNKPKPKI